MENFKDIVDIDIDIDKLDEVKQTKYFIPLNEKLNEKEKVLLSKINKVNNYFGNDTFGITEDCEINNILNNVNVYDCMNFEISKTNIELSPDEFVKLVKEQQIKLVYRINEHTNSDNYGKCSELYLELVEYSEEELEDSEEELEDSEEELDSDLENFMNDMDTWYGILDKINYDVPYRQQYMCMCEQFTIFTVINTCYQVPNDSLINDAVENLYRKSIDKLREKIEKQEQYNIQQEKLNIEKLEQEFRDIIAGDEKFKLCTNQKLREGYLKEKILTLDNKFQPLIERLCIQRYGYTDEVVRLSDYGMMFLNNVKNSIKGKRS